MICDKLLRAGADKSKTFRAKTGGCVYVCVSVVCVCVFYMCVECHHTSVPGSAYVLFVLRFAVFSLLVFLAPE